MPTSWGVPRASDGGRPPLPVKELPAAAQADEEVRVGTLFFADVVNSSAILASHGAENAMTIMNDAIGLASECVRRFGGTVNRITGDGVMAMPAGAPNMEIGRAHV